MVLMLSATAQVGIETIAELATNSMPAHPTGNVIKFAVKANGKSKTASPLFRSGV